MTLAGKTALVFGIANRHSIGWGIARALRGAGAQLAMTYRREGRARHVAPLAAELQAPLLVRCDARDDAHLASLFAQVRQTFGRLDIIVHAAAGASTEDLGERYLDTTRERFLDALEVSTFSLTALVQAAGDLLQPGASVLTLSYHGARQVAAGYNVMGVAKAALETSVRYLAADLGPRAIRVNAISAGPIRTISASAIAGFRSRHRRLAERTLLGRHVTIDDVGALALWLCSDAGAAVTGETLYVDAGLHQVARVPATAQGQAGSDDPRTEYA